VVRKAAGHEAWEIGEQDGTTYPRLAETAAEFLAEERDAPGGVEVEFQAAVGDPGTSRL
jgi:hypothetical protein